MGKSLLLILLVAAIWLYSDARELTGFTRTSEVVSVLEPNEELSEGEAQSVKEISKNNQLCSLCEDFAAEAITYLSENKTQTEIITILHKSCSKIPSFKQQVLSELVIKDLCIVLVDYYAPLFFLEVSTIEAEDFCRKVDLCEAVTTLKALPKNKCDICHNAITEALLKLKDPDTELEIIQLLLKACNSAGKSVKKCKKLVFEYAPIILVNAEQFLETNDVCTILHACDSEEVGGTETSMHSAS